MEDDYIIQVLCAAVQGLLTGDAEVVDGELRLPAETLKSHDNLAVKFDEESEPGHLIYSLVPYPPEGS